MEAIELCISQLLTCTKFRSSHTRECSFKGIGGKGSNSTQFKKPQGVAVNGGLVYVCMTLETVGYKYLTHNSILHPALERRDTPQAV